MKNDYIFAYYVDLNTRTYTATARSESGSKHWKRNGIEYSTPGSVKMIIMLDNLSEDEARLEKAKFFQTMQYYGYTSRQHGCCCVSH